MQVVGSNGQGTLARKLGEVPLCFSAAWLSASRLSTDPLKTSGNRGASTAFSTTRIYCTYSTVLYSTYVCIVNNKALELPNPESQQSAPALSCCRIHPFIPAAKSPHNISPKLGYAYQGTARKIESPELPSQPNRHHRHLRDTDQPRHESGTTPSWCCNT